MAALSFTGAMVRPVGGLLADRLSGVRVLLVLLSAIALCNFGFAALMPTLVGGVALLAALYLCFGLGNGATFQLVPHRWKGKTGLMTGIIGAAGGIGGFYLPVVMGMAKESTGSYQLGFRHLRRAGGAALVLVVASAPAVAGLVGARAPSPTRLGAARRLSTRVPVMKLVVIGNGMVGQRLLEQLEREPRRFDITVLCEEPRPAYDRVHLTAFFSGKSAEDLSLVERRFLRAARHRAARSAERAVAYRSRAAPRAHLPDRELSYDQLVLATGSYPFVPPIPGQASGRGCFVYRTIEDLEAIRAAGAGARAASSSAAGCSGLEAAKALHGSAVWRRMSWSSRRV